MSLSPFGPIFARATGASRRFLRPQQALDEVMDLAWSRWRPRPKGLAGHATAPPDEGFSQLNDSPICSKLNTGDPRQLRRFD
jgi:hypothetical protein